MNKENKLVKFISSINFGLVILIFSTLIEAFYAYKLFTITGAHIFGETAVIIVGVFYAFIMGLAISYFTLKNNTFMVNFFIAFALSLNLLLDVMMSFYSKTPVENAWIIFIAQLIIGTAIPFITKSLATSLSTQVEEIKKGPGRPKKEVDGV